MFLLQHSLPEQDYQFFSCCLYDFDDKDVDGEEVINYTCDCSGNHDEDNNNDDQDDENDDVDDDIDCKKITMSTGIRLVRGSKFALGKKCRQKQAASSSTENEAKVPKEEDLLQE